MRGHYVRACGALRKQDVLRYRGSDLAASGGGVGRVLLVPAEAGAQALQAVLVLVQPGSDGEVEAEEHPMDGLLGDHGETVAKEALDQLALEAGVQGADALGARDVHDHAKDGPAGGLPHGARAPELLVHLVVHVPVREGDEVLVILVFAMRAAGLQPGLGRLDRVGKGACDSFAGGGEKERHERAGVVGFLLGKNILPKEVLQEEGNAWVQ